MGLAAVTDSVAAIDPAADPEWDRFVEGGGGRFAHAYHLAAWRAVHRRAYGRDPIYLAARDRNGDVVGGLPLVVHGGALRGLAASLKPGTSTAGSLARVSSVVRGGPIAADVDSRAGLLRSACGLVAEGGLTDLRIETDVPGCEQLVPGPQAVPDSPVWVTQLPPDPTELLQTWRKQSRNLWRSIAKAQQRGVVVRPVRSRTDLWRFYRQHVLAMNAGSDPRAGDRRPMHAVYWRAVEWAIANGKTVADWGSAPVDSSLAEFKRQWGAEPVQCFRYTYAPGGTVAEPSGGGDRDSGAEGISAALWDRLPVGLLGVAATVGHRLL